MTVSSPRSAPRDLPTWRFVAAMACYTLGCWQLISNRYAGDHGIWFGAGFMLSLTRTEGRQPVTRQVVIHGAIAVAIALAVFILLPKQIVDWLAVSRFIVPAVMLAGWPCMFWQMRQRWRRRRTEASANEAALP